MSNEKQLYTCPMHPEIVSDKPGKCPKCGGMDLVPMNNVRPATPKKAEDRGLGKVTIKSYAPIIVVVSMIFISALIASWRGEFALDALLLNFMTGFFLVFAGFKLMDLKGFAEGYATYDLLASRVKAYGYAYPFIELAFGLLMLAGYHPDWLLWTEFAVMMFSGLGVSIKIAKREPFMCACLGTFLKVPLTYVTLIEDFGMAILAIALLALA